MNKLSESCILVIGISLIVLTDNFVWTLRENGYIDIADYTPAQELSSDSKVLKKSLND